MFNKIVNYFLIIFFLVIITIFLFINNYEVGNNYYIEINSENISKVNNLIEYLKAPDIKDIHTINLFRFNNDPDNYTIELHYYSIDNVEKIYKENINTSYIRQYKNFLKNALDYIKNNGTKSSDFLTYELLVNDSNVNQISYLSTYLKLDNVSSINRLELTTNNDLNIYYDTTTGEKELIFQYHFEENEIYRDNPIINSIIYIEENSNIESKNSILNIIIIYILISLIIVVIIIAFISIISSIIKSINKNYDK